MLDKEISIWTQTGPIPDCWNYVSKTAKDPFRLLLSCDDHYTVNELDYAHNLETSKECDDEYVSLSEFDSVRHLELNSCDCLDEYD